MSSSPTESGVPSFFTLISLRDEGVADEAIERCESSENIANGMGWEIQFEGCDNEVLLQLPLHSVRRITAVKLAMTVLSTKLRQKTDSYDLGVIQLCSLL